jgi:hypothetical protein
VAIVPSSVLIRQTYFLPNPLTIDILVLISCPSDQKTASWGRHNYLTNGAIGNVTTIGVRIAPWLLQKGRWLHITATDIASNALRQSRRGTHMKSKLTYILLLTLSLAIIPAAHAKEGGDQYPNGADNWLPGALPPPGQYYINYAGYYHGELKTGAGNKVVLPDGSTPSVTAEFNALRFIEVTPFKLLGADYAVHVVVPLVDQTINLGGSNGKFALGDVIFSPLVLGWHKKELHVVAAFDIDAPTGSYTKTDPRISIGANYFGFEPVIAITYLPKSKWEISSRIAYNFKSTNGATNYHSGDDFHLDYAVGKHLGAWIVGANGYFLKQVTDDTVAGTTVAAAPGVYDAGRRGQVFSFGPSLNYTTKNHTMLMAYWEHEAEVRNRFGGDKVWLKMIIPISSLFPKRL